MTRGRTLTAAIAATLTSTLPALAGPEWNETDDAGSLPADADRTEGIGELQRITGTLSSGAIAAGGAQLSHSRERRHPKGGETTRDSRLATRNWQLASVISPVFAMRACAKM